MPKSMFRALMATTVWLVSAHAGADETIYCNAYITALPYTITTQGHYCLDRNLSTAQASGAAITIASDFVVLDLNGFKLGGGSAGLSTAAIGIKSTNQSSITIRNGNIRGFATAIKLARVPNNNGPFPTNLLVESNVVDGNTAVGIWVIGRASLIRNNQVYNTGGSTATPHPWYGCSAGINAIYDDSGNPIGQADVIGNTVSGMSYPATGNCFGGLEPGVWGIIGGLAMKNHVKDLPSTQFAKITAYYCKENTVSQASGLAYNCIVQMLGGNFP